MTLSIINIVVAILATFSVVSLSLYLSFKLHNQMVESVTRAPVLFFDSNPLGRIINRFSKDTANADGSVPLQLIVFLGVSINS